MIDHLLEIPFLSGPVAFSIPSHSFSADSPCETRITSFALPISHRTSPATGTTGKIVRAELVAAGNSIEENMIAEETKVFLDEVPKRIDDS
jgi:hypothetical protein